ncbi:MAG: RNA polymerase sigma-70 factor [Chitinophagaceae bacterium]|nr:RNA polymerase sigma-70 factor [Chitinophagaceae bacterium]MCW5928411.1 RNA polymerase sigma-70 factor [Chitinophagaceae bacterium]
MKLLSLHNDEILLKLLREDDSVRAFEVLYNRYWKKLLAEAAFHTGSQQEAEEIVQQVFLNVWKLRKELVIRYSFYTYVASSVKYGIMASLAREKRQKHTREKLSQNLKIEDNYTLDWIDSESVRRQLEQTIEKLPQKCRLVFRMSRGEGFTEKQIAGALNISGKTVQAHITYALKALKTSLQKATSFLF